MFPKLRNTSTFFPRTTTFKNTNPSEITFVQKRGIFRITYPTWSHLGLLPFLSADSINTHQEYHRKSILRVNHYTEEMAAQYGDHTDLIDMLKQVAKDNQNIVFTNHISSAVNHQFFWDTIERTPFVKSEGPSDELLTQLNIYFGGFEKFKNTFEEYAVAQHGNGWTWLAEKEGQLEILNTKDEASLFAVGDEVTPILCLDMAEHSYFPDYGFDSRRYAQNFWKVVNWEVVNDRLGKRS